MGKNMLDRMSDKMKELASRSGGVSFVFRTFPCGNHSWNIVPARIVQELACESARVFGEGYIHKAIFYADKEGERVVTTEIKSFCEMPRFNEDSGHPDGYGNEKILIARTASTEYVDFDGFLDAHEEEFRAETVFRKEAVPGQSFYYNCARGTSSRLYRLTPINRS